MSDDKAIKKSERGALHELEKICGVSFSKVFHSSVDISENRFDIREDDGSITRLGLDFEKIDIDNQKINLIGEQVSKFTSLEELLIKKSKDKNLPEWIKNLASLKTLIAKSCGLTSIPEFIKELSNLTNLDMSYNMISQLPDWLPDLPNLKRINIFQRRPDLVLSQSNFGIFRSLVEKGVEVSNVDKRLHLDMGIPLEKVSVLRHITTKSGDNNIIPLEMKSADRPLDELRKYVIEPRIVDGKIVHLAIFQNYIPKLPDNIGELEDLEKINLKYNSLTSLPESFGNLKKLKELDLSDNQLTSLPESFVNLTSITKLNLINNQLIEIPTQLWALKELTDLDLSGNPLNPEDLNLSKKTPDVITETLRKKATIRIFISHAVIDFEPYRIEELVNYLESQKEISQVLFCEEDMSGSIDQWMLDNVQRCQLVLFIGTNKSVFNSVDCDNELQLANKFSIPVIPLKGMDIDWPDLAEKKLSRQLGLEYDLDNFDEFCANIYKYIENLKREINLMEKTERLAGITDIYERFRLMLDEKLSDVSRKMDQMIVTMERITERLDRLENK
ncbi:MAG: leucine-rich repeat domain-containing protein [Promethearchaeota archaeon]